MPKKTTKTKKPEKKDKNWWRKYTTEYQDEDFSKKESKPKPPTSNPQPQTLKKSVVRFNDREMMPDMSNMTKEIENMMRGLLKSNFTTNSFRKPAMPRLVRMKEGTFRKPISGVKETSDKVIVTIELPGVQKDNINIHVEGMNLIIEAQSQSGNENKKRGFFSFSKSYTGFRHIVRLPTPVDKDNSQAHYESGVLRIVLKKQKSRDSGDISIE
jgi:HSP20 family protein